MSTADPAQFQINAFWASLGTSIGFSALLALLFCFVRPRHTLVYAPKTKHSDEQHAPPPMGKGLFSWIGPVAKAKENVLVDKIGLDAVIFLRFARMLRNIFVALGLIGLLVMIPVNVTMRNKGISGGVDAFAVMTPLYVFGNGLWSQVVCAWAFDIIVCYFLWHNYQRVRSLRRGYFESREYQLSLHARTLIVRDLPSAMRSDEGILRVTDEVNPTGVLPRTTVGRNVRVLPDLIEEHEEHVKELESVLAKFLKDPDKLPAARPMMKPPKKYQGDRVGGKVDAIQFLTDRIRELEQEIREIRDRVDKRDTMRYGFASWDQIEQAHTVAFAARKKKPQGATVRLAPRPNELIWGNLHLTPKKRVVGYSPYPAMDATQRCNCHFLV
jgi:calcium permeable stress-gated cation channel